MIPCLFLQTLLRMNPWIMLLLAGLCEVVWAVALKHSDGWSRLLPSAVAVVFMVLSVWGLALAQKTLPLGSSYAVWVGIGVVGTLLAGVLMLGEPVSALKIISALMVLGGMVGLKLASGTT